MTQTIFGESLFGIYLCYLVFKFGLRPIRLRGEGGVYDLVIKYQILQQLFLNIVSHHLQHCISNRSFKYLKPALRSCLSYLNANSNRFQYILLYFYLIDFYTSLVISYLLFPGLIVKKKNKS